MSLSKSALLAGSSLAAALSLGATSALAQATCASAPAPTSGNATTAVVYGAGTYNPGITCVYVGTASTVSTTAAITVSSTAGGDGINLSATGSDSVSWTSTAGTVTAGANTNGPVIEATTANGTIALTTGAVSGTNATVTHGLLATSTGGQVNVSTAGGTVTATGATVTGQTGIRATTASATNGVSVTAAAITATGYGVRTTTTGGTNSVTTTGTVNVNSATLGETGIEATSTTGAITINAAQVTGQRYGIRAESTSGDIGVTLGGTASATNSTYGDTGLRTVTGGDGEVDISLANNGRASGRLRGIYAQTGAGDLTLDIRGQAQANTAGVGAVAIDAVTGTGSMLTINLEGRVTGSFVESAFAESRTSTTGLGTAIRSRPGGDAAISLGNYTRLQGLTALDLGVPTGTTTTVTAVNNPLDGFFDRDATVMGDIVATGGGMLLMSFDGRLTGAVNAPSFSGASTLAMGSQGIWFTEGRNQVFGGGDDRLTIAAGGEVLAYDEQDASLLPMYAEGGVVYTGARMVGTTETGGIEPVQTFTFGAGDDEVDNAGYFYVGALPTTANGNFSSGGGSTTDSFTWYEAETQLVGLETFTNRGVVALGSRQETTSDQGRGYMDNLSYRALNLTDNYYDDILNLPGTTFKGSRVLDGNGETARRWTGELAVGEVWMDIDLTKSGTNCVRTPGTGDLGGSDCLLLTGGTTDVSDGLIYVRLFERVPGDRGILNSDGIVLVDMGSTGTSEQGHVAISPNQRGYNPQFGGYLDKGGFAYLIAYDEAAHQHKLFSGPSQNTFQMPLMAQATHSLWRTSTGSWFDRQADMRGDLDGYIGGVWARISGEKAERDVVHSLSFAGQDFDFDNSFEQKSYAVTGGFDLLFGSEGDTAYVAGLTIGYAHADLTYQASPNEARIESWTGGAYASFVSGGLYIDATVNAHNSLLRYDAPAMDLFPDGTILDTDMMSIGGQVEAGLRLPVLAEGVFVEPLVGLSLIRTEFNDLYIPPDDPGREGVTVKFDNPTSLRTGIGARAGIDRDFGVVRAQFSGLARLWNEFEDGTRAELLNPGDTGVVTDDFGGAFTELGLGASVYSPGGAVSGFVNLGGKIADDYQAQTVSGGLRVNW